MKTYSFRIITVLLLLFQGISTVNARPQGETDSFFIDFTEKIIRNDPIPDNPDLYFGVLNNGLSYYVLPNMRPSNKAQLRLVIAAGSLVEEDDQRGMAGLIPQLLFRSMGKKAENMLGSGKWMGTASFDKTVFHLSVNSDDGELETGLDILNQFAFNAEIDQDSYDRISAEIYDEWWTDKEDFFHRNEKLLSVLLKGSRHAERLPIYMNVPLSAAKQFYAKWYRPDLMAIIVVGDVNPDETLAIIRELFEKQPSPQAPSFPATYFIPQHVEPRIVFIPDTGIESSQTSIYIQFPATGKKTMPDIKQMHVHKLFHQMLTNRLTELTRKNESPYFQANSTIANTTVNSNYSIISAVGQGDKVLLVFEGLLTEIERVRRFGFLQDEFNHVKNLYLRISENKWQNRINKFSMEMAGTIVDAFLTGNPIPSDDWQWQAVKELVPAITLDDINKEIPLLLNKRNQTIAFTFPPDNKKEPPKKDDITEILNRLKRQKLTAQVLAPHP